MSDDNPNQPEPSVTPEPEPCSDDSSSSCTLSSSSPDSSPPGSPPSLIPITLIQESLLRQETFNVNDALISNIMEMGVSLNMARLALFYTGNSSVELALQWLLENRNIATIDQGLSDLMEDEYNSDLDSMDTTLILFVNKSLNLSSGEMSLAGARATARVMKQVKDLLGMEAVNTWNQCGRHTEVRKVEDTKEMISIAELVKSGSFSSLIVQDSGLMEGEERKVMALFGNRDEVEAIFGIQD